jgi:hypothetical protein
MDSPKRAVIQQFAGEIVANLKLDQFAATLRADNSAGAVFADFPSFRTFCHVVPFPLFIFFYQYKYQYTFLHRVMT